MSNQKKCIDFYGERLGIGDEVIPILEEALIIGIGGTISKIEYSEKYNDYYITINDKDGNVLLKNVDARCYTTQSRFDERENQEYVYSLTFYNNMFRYMTTLPLTNRTDLNYVIPDEACFVTLDAQHLETKGKKLNDNSCICPLYNLSSIYYFIIDGKVKLCCEEENDLYYLLNSKTHDCYQINKNYKIFKNGVELKAYIKSIIAYFNSADLTYVNNDEIFNKNKNGKKFEKNLIKKLEH